MKACLIGNPVSHSISPTLHKYWLDKYKIDGFYNAIKVENNVADVIKSIIADGYSGFNITIPHKESVFNLIKNEGFLSNAAKAIGAVNTVVINSDKKLEGHNSDEYGFFESLRNNCNLSEIKNCFIIGAGGAARSVIFSLIINCNIKNIFITNRTKDKFDKICEYFYFIKDLGVNFVFLEKNEFEKKLNNCDLLINSTSLGMLNQEPLSLDISNLKHSAIVYDLIYKPLHTEFLLQAKNKNHKIINGIEMLAFQAALGFEKWFKIKPEINNDFINFLTNCASNN